jgi:hypothetical protein
VNEREKSKQCNGAALVVYHKANTNYNYYTGSRAAIEFGPINETRQQLNAKAKAMFSLHV